ncbi:hypothetical protein [Chryseobacterium gallinarum]|uniref:Uncharacterized protein n=1 Tax=Chryseobacterium gallinarum TaxID=1324352 RepID=A0ABX6KUD4_CHRGL|nr:hypothetical protein [Chryseobacterium gallinarum]QIY92218.1 hypothetical protein FOB44_16800 [Chryseobacterium gallinarum]
MSHQEKQRIFDEYAKQQGYEDWDSLCFDYDLNLMSDRKFQNNIFAACDLVQEEQQKRIVENVKVHIVDVDRYGDETIIEKCDSSGFPLMYAKDFSEDNNVAVDQSSIINPENKIQ